MKAAILSWLAIPCLRRRKRRRRGPVARDAIDDFGVEADFSVIPADADDSVTREAARGSSLPGDFALLTSTSVGTTTPPYPAQPPPAYSCAWPQQHQAAVGGYDYSHISSPPLYPSPTLNVVYPHALGFSHSMATTWQGPHHFSGWWSHSQPAPAPAPVPAPPSQWTHQPPMHSGPAWPTTYRNDMITPVFGHGHFSDVHTYGATMPVGLEGSAGGMAGYGTYEHFDTGPVSAQPFTSSESSSPATPMLDSRPVSSSPPASSREEDIRRVELPSFDAAFESRNDTCAICLSLLREGKVSAGPCKHVMHTACLKLWLCRDRHGACPVCRVPYDNADWVRQPFVRSSSSVASASTAYTRAVVRPVANSTDLSP